MPRISLRALKPPKPTMQLDFELIPKSAWYKNVRTELSKEDWDILRRYVYRRADFKCQICGGVGPNHPVECHEKWSYNEVAKVQKLVDLIALCPKCHGVKHLGYSRHSLSKTKFERLLSHQRRINKWSKVVQGIKWETAREWYRRRCEVEWTVDISHARRMLEIIKSGGRP